MREEKLEELLSELGKATEESPPAGLRDQVRGRIPARLPRHIIGWDAISIVIDTRLSKLAVAAAITVATVLFATFFGPGDLANGAIYEDGKLVISYCLGGQGAGRARVLDRLSDLYEDMLSQGKDVCYYGDSVDASDKNAVLMCWKLSDGKYMVVLNDFTARAASPDALIRLQSLMLQNRRKR